MRIISGSHKGRLLNPPQNLKVRPTTDIAKEGLFNILTNRVDFSELKVLDLFTGTGSISFEFASRGCPDITSVDNNFKHLLFVNKIVADYGLSAIKTVKYDAFQFLAKSKNKFNLIFADPPYDIDKIETIPAAVFDNKLLMPAGILIIEHDKSKDFSKHEHFVELRKYSKVHFSFFVQPEVL